MRLEFHPRLTTLLTAIFYGLLTGVAPAQNQGENPTANPNAASNPDAASNPNPTANPNAASNPDAKTEQNSAAGKARDAETSSPRGDRTSANQAQRGGGELTDQSLSEAIREKLDWDSSVSVEKIEVTVEDGRVTLEGEVPSHDQMRRAAMVARSRNGVREVVNELTVSAGDMSDEDIRSQVQQVIEEDPAFAESGVKAEVKDGRVSLSGVSPTYGLRTRLEQSIGELAGVRGIDNQINTAAGEARDDDQVRDALQRRFRNDAWLSQSEIEITVNDGSIALSGSVPSADVLERARDRAQAFGRQIDTSGLTVNGRRNGRTNGARQSDAADANNANREDRVADRSRGNDEIRDAVREAIDEDSRFSGREIDVEVKDGRVTLSGQVGSRLLKSEAVRLARNTAGVSNVTDRIEVSVGDQVDAEALGERISRTLGRNSELRGRQIESEYRDGTVILSGTVGSGYARNKAESLVSGLDGVREVENRIEVEGDGNTGFTYYDYYGFHDYSDRAVRERDKNLTDDELKAKVEREFFWSWYVDGGDIDVNVTDGTVVLTGEVSDLAEKQAAERNAREAGAVEVENRLDIAQN